MPTLSWIGKPAVLTHHRTVPFRLLTAVKSHTFHPASGDGNLLVEGDNLHALKSLLPFYARSIKAIYIDPPYNTGNEKWEFNDNVNHPDIQKWLGTVVGKESEDLTRHDKWLCMMYPRLILLRELLRDDGVIFISIGNDEFGHLRLICDEIFGSRNLLETFIRQFEGNVENQEDITGTHDYVLAYEKRHGLAHINRTVDPNVADDSKLRRDFAENSTVKNGARNPASVVHLPAGFPCAVRSLDLPADPHAEEFVQAIESGDGYISRDARDKWGLHMPVRLDDMQVRDFALVRPCRVYSGWSSGTKFRLFITNDCQPIEDDDGSKLRYYLSNTGVPTYKRENRMAHFVPTILRNMGTTERASNELERMGVQFSYPKPVEFVQYLLSLVVNDGDTVLDAFAGSGTAGHAALQLARDSEISLRFVLVELETRVAQNVTAPRLKAAIQGYRPVRGSRRNSVPGLGGGFTYCRLGTSLFNSSGQIQDEVSYDALARHVYFSETRKPLNGRPESPPLLGSTDDLTVYLLYNGVLDDRSRTGGNVLTRNVLRQLPIAPHSDGVRVIYGTGCTLSQSFLRQRNIVFKQIPYEIRIS